MLATIIVILGTIVTGYSAYDGIKTLRQNKAK